MKFFIKNYNDDSDIEYFLEVDVQYVEKLHKLHNNLSFFLERMKIEKLKKLASKLYDKKYMLYT